MDYNNGTHTNKSYFLTLYTKTHYNTQTLTHSKQDLKTISVFCHQRHLIVFKINSSQTKALTSFCTRLFAYHLNIYKINSPQTHASLQLLCETMPTDIQVRPAAVSSLPESQNNLLLISKAIYTNRLATGTSLVALFYR